MFPSRNFLQMPMLQPHMMNIRIEKYGIQKNTEGLYEIKKYDVLKIVVIRRASAHIVRIIIRYARIDSVQCLNGQ